MIIPYEDLQFWNITTGRDPFTTAFLEAKKIVESGQVPLINWSSTKVIDVSVDGDQSNVKVDNFKKFRQKTKKKVVKLKKIRVQ